MWPLNTAREGREMSPARRSTVLWGESRVVGQYASDRLRGQRGCPKGEQHGTGERVQGGHAGGHQRRVLGEGDSRSHRGGFANLAGPAHRPRARARRTYRGRQVADVSRQARALVQVRGRLLIGPAGATVQTRSPPPPLTPAGCPLLFPPRP